MYKLHYDNFLINEHDDDVSILTRDINFLKPLMSY